MLNKLQAYIAELGSVLVCYSGGVDSALLLHVCAGISSVRTEAVFFDSVLVPRQDVRHAVDFASSISPAITLHTIKHDIFTVDGLESNPQNRCYICKRAMLQQANVLASEHGLNSVLEGSHVDDLQDYRPGRAAIQELGILSPFEAVGMGKLDIRRLSQALGLAEWNRPSFSCLLTRLEHDKPVNTHDLHCVEQVEERLRSLGMRNFRARHRQTAVLLELSEADRLICSKNKAEIDIFLNGLGYGSIELVDRL